MEILLKAIHTRCPELPQGRSDFLVEEMVVTKVIVYFCVTHARIDKLGIIKVYKNSKEISVLSED